MLHKKRKPSTFTSSSGFADCKRNATSNNNMLHSKSTYFYRWLPISCSLAFLLGLGIIFNPVMSDIDKASATTVTANPTDYSSISLTISHSNTDGSSTELNTGDTVSTNVEPGLVSYITNNLRIDTKKINRFYVSIQAAEDGSSELTGTNNHATIAPVGNNKIPTATDGNGFGDNTWGFALGEANTANESMSYNSLPAYGASTTPQYSSATNLADGTYNLKLTFAAKINADKPSDHYTTKAMVSVAADAAKLTWDNIERMQDMTPEICNNASAGASKQLVDDRTASGIADQNTYWVTKLKDNKCWMTQNLDLPLKQGDILKPDDTDVTADYTVPALGYYQEMGDYVYTQASANLPSSGCSSAPSGCTSYFAKYTGSVDGDTQMHYHVGNLYPWTIAMAGKTTENSGSICPKGWRLPTNSEYSSLISGVDQNAIRRDPYYFVPSGVYNSGWLNVGGGGSYWSSTPNGSSNAYVMYFNGNGINTGVNDRTYGYSVRCVVK